MPPIRLHSKYNPHREAEQFVSAIEGTPAVIVITEPGESYLAPALRERFPHAALIAVRYTDSEFYSSDILWDAVWRPAQKNLSFFLLSHIPDEQLPSTRFLSWKAADRAYPEAADRIWKHIRTAVEILQSLMHTRSFFGAKWLRNMFRNFIRTANPAAVDFGSRDFILAGAGPSLQPLSVRETNGYSIVAVCSAYSALAAKDIPINLAVTTDAGYWAVRHCDGIPATLPIAFPLEAAVPSLVLERNPCIPLSYGSPLERCLFSAAGFAPLAARENGTVSGTACELLLAHTPYTVILAGLDLAASKGFSHAQPHSGSSRAACITDRLRPLAGTLAVQNFQIKSLEAYRQWFLQLPSEKTRRLLRLDTGGCALPNIKTKPLAELRLRKPAGVPLSVKPCGGVISAKERRQAASALLRTLKDKLDTVVRTAPSPLTETAKSLEKQVCALCAYPAYCALLKSPDDQTVRNRLAEETGAVLSSLIERISHDGF